MLFVIVHAIGGKITLTVAIKEKVLNEGDLIGDLAKEINGGGGGHPHYSTTGGSNVFRVLKPPFKTPETC